MDDVERTPADSLYETDFYSWTQEQARLIETGQFARVDVKNLTEEIETLGRSEESSLESAYRLICLHLLKLTYQADKTTRSWEVTIGRERIRAARILRKNPGLKSSMTDLFADAYADGRKEAALETGLPEPRFPKDPPFSLEQAMDEQFWGLPPSRFGTRRSRTPCGLPS